MTSNPSWRSSSAVAGPERSARSPRAEESLTVKTAAVLMLIAKRYHGKRQSFRLPKRLGWDTRVFGMELFRDALGMFVHFIAELAQVKNAGGGYTREEGFELDGNRRRAEQGLDEFHALGFRLAEIGIAYGVAIGNPRRRLLVTANDHLEDHYLTFCRGFRIVFSQGAPSRKLQKVRGIFALLGALDRQYGCLVFTREQ